MLKVEFTQNELLVLNSLFEVALKSPNCNMTNAKLFVALHSKIEEVVKEANKPKDEEEAAG